MDNRLLKILELAKALSNDKLLNLNQELIKLIKQKRDEDTARYSAKFEVGGSKLDRTMYQNYIMLCA